MKMTVTLEWKWQDMWIGVFWRTTKVKTDLGERPFVTDVWVCLLPCLLIHLVMRHSLIIPYD